MRDLVLTPLTLADLEAAVGLARQAGWNDTREDWEAVLACGPGFGHRGPDGALVSTSVLCDFGAWTSVAKVLVTPSRQRQGLAREAVQACLALRQDRPASLIATPEGRPLYERLGFQEISLVGSWRGVLRASPTSGLALLRAREEHLEGLVALDRQVLGGDRRPVLTSRLRTAHQSWLLAGPEDVRGLALSVRQQDLLVVGPVLAPGLPEAVALLEAATRGWPGPLRIDVPAAQVGLREWLARAGLVERSLRPEMTLGGSPLPGARHQRFVLASQGFG